MKKVLILEDNKSTLQCLEQIVKDINHEIVVFALSNVKDAYQYMLEYTVDVFIIDIILDPFQRGDTSGLRFAERVRSLEKYLFTPMIFITSLEDSKYITYEKLHCYSFIEKPFDPQQVQNVIAQCLKYADREEKEHTIFFRNDGVIFSVNIEEMVYGESRNHMFCVHMRNGDVIKIPYITMKNFLDTADSRSLLKCSRNAVINTKLIKNIDIANRVIELSTGHRIEIGLKYKKILKDFVNASYSCIYD